MMTPTKGIEKKDIGNKEEEECMFATSLRSLEDDLDPSQVEVTSKSQRRNRDLSSQPPPRLIDRSSTFHQSRGRWRIRRMKEPSWSLGLYLRDPFHSILHLETPKIIALLTGVYAVVVAIFAGLYLQVPRECNLAIATFTQALYFSLETMITIGYGAQGGDIFFNECASPLVLIGLQSLVGILVDALAIGLIFSRFARAQARATSVLFSNEACVRRLRGALYIHFQVCEMRKHQLVEAHVRCYVIKNMQPDFVFQSFPLRLQHPDDDLGSMLLMALPSVVVHRLDAWSPLHPSSSGSSSGFSSGYHSSDDRLLAHDTTHDPSRQYVFPEPFQRAADYDCGSQDYREQPLSGKPRNNPNTHRRACLHLHDCPDHSMDEHVEIHGKELDHLGRFWDNADMEIVVLVEGIDAATSATIQARHSYRREDILMDRAFENCVTRDSVTGEAVIDFSKFHETRPVDLSCANVRGSFH